MNKYEEEDEMEFQKKLKLFGLSNTTNASAGDYEPYQSPYQSSWQAPRTTSDHNYLYKAQADRLRNALVNLMDTLTQEMPEVVFLNKESKLLAAYRAALELLR
jgi:hypothetical protein